MEPTPARGQQKGRKTWIAEAEDAQSFQSELVRVLTSELGHEAVFGRVESGSNIPQLPVWIKAHLERHSGLMRKLEQGELVGINHVEQIQGPRPAAAARSSVFLFPVIGHGVLQGAIGLISPMDGPQIPHEDLEVVRQLAEQAGPVLGRILELQRLSEENDALRRENAERKNLQMRSHLQANVAHELRTPLAAVRGYTRMILDGRAGQPNDTQMEYLRIVGDNTTRLINLVNWMTHILEISADDFQLTRFDLRDVWRECRTNATTMKINEVIPDEPFMVAGDRRKIASVITQLLCAAQHLSTSKSSVAIQFLRGREREITVKVSDAGAVIPSELLKAIFDRSFSSVPMPLAPSAEGSELGLSGIYDIVGMHGGRFFVNSKTGQGVTFLFTLPAVQLDGEEKLSHEQAVNSGR
jgi:signal transduction histidine kinase